MTDKSNSWEALAELLNDTKPFLQLPENDFIYSKWENADEALATIERLVGELEAGKTACIPEISILFAPTGSLQEISMSGGWSQEFLHLAEKVDEHIEEIKKQESMKNINKKNFVISSVVWYVLFKIIFYAVFMASDYPSGRVFLNPMGAGILFCLLVITVMLTRVWLQRIKTVNVTGTKRVLAMSALLISLWGAIVSLVGSSLGFFSDRFEGHVSDYIQLILILAGFPASLCFFFYLIFKPEVTVSTADKTGV